MARAEGSTPESLRLPESLGVLSYSRFRWFARRAERKLKKSTFVGGPMDDELPLE